MTEVKYRRLKDLVPLDRNPRTIDEADISALAVSIEKNPDFFEARPLILSNRTGKLVVIAGNQKFKAAELLGLEEVPTVLIEGLTEEREREIIIRDNVHAGNWDKELLYEDWSFEELASFGLTLPELEEDEEPFSGAIKEKEVDETLATDHKCPKCGYEW